MQCLVIMEEHGKVLDDHHLEFLIKRPVEQVREGCPDYTGAGEEDERRQ